MTDGFVTTKFAVHPDGWDTPVAEIESNGDGTAFVQFARGLGHDGSAPIEVAGTELRGIAAGLVRVAERLEAEARDNLEAEP